MHLVDDKSSIFTPSSCLTEHGICAIATSNCKAIQEKQARGALEVLCLASDNFLGAQLETAASEIDGA